MERLYIDIETFSPTDVKSGVYRYSEDPEFLILMAGWARNDGPVNVAVGEEEILAIPGLWNAAVMKVAHNAAFERICFSRLGGNPTGKYLSPAAWHDTAAVAAELGYPRKLSEAAKFLGLEAKDGAGTRLINLFSKPNRKGQRNLPEDYPDEWLEFIEYCRQDVVVLRDLDRALGEFPTSTERSIYLVDQKINDRGLRVDRALCESALVAMEDSVWQNELEISHLTGVMKPSSVQQLGNWLKESGLSLPNMRAETVADALDRDDLTDTQRAVLTLRQELALSSVKKFPAALAQMNVDDRLRGRFQFFGAHTGRWAGRGAQPQNLPRESLEDDAATEAAVLDLLMGLPTNSFTLKALVRSMFWVDGTVVDFASIEARVLAWWAGEEWALEAFRGGRDIYVETAARMSTPGKPLTRSQGKVAVLALGYNGGVASLRVMGAEGTDSELKWRRDQWRAANPKIVQSWKDMGNAFRLGGEVGEHIRIEKDGKSRYMVLPSGRSIGYHRCVFKREMTDFGMRWDMSFANPEKPWQRVRTYGGKLAENATQAIARDIQGEALIRLDLKGFRPVGHVHDEILVEGTNDVAAVSKIMTKVPSWAVGLPIDAEGFTTARYKKE